MMPAPADFEVFVSGDRAFAAFERAVLAAKVSVTGGFRIFDLRTTLVSDEAREIGETWFDLLAHVVDRGVTINLAISDFDPVYGTELHELTWSTVKQVAALREATGADRDRVNIRAALHPATPGAIPWLAFLPETLRRAWAKKRALTKAARAHAPGLKSAMPALHTVTHHQKLAVIDDDTLYIGGLDLNDRRFDTRAHDRPATETWSDVQVIVRNDPVIAEAKAHLASFEAVVRRREKPPVTRQLRRTMSTNRRFKAPFLSPLTIVNEIERAHLDAIRDARNLIYIETQYMRSKRIANALAEAAHENPDVRLIMVLPALPDDAAFEDRFDDIGLETRFGLALENEALAIIKQGFGERGTIAAPVQPVMAPADGNATHAGSPIIYVHNKVLVRDADFAVVGSANLNGRSLRWDTEAGLAITDPGRIELLRNTLFSHWWWHGPPTGAWLDPAAMQPVWHAEILRNHRRLPQNRTGFLVPHDTAVHAEEGQPIPLITEDMV
ncbi:phospholipase D-like domain-containing protein [Cognatishimia sp. F0-27]|uniref:phospholipase D family protein n=1 Tax=Cognatishimia sp. F0-27 TaxID=2816855 RepID=UPI001D0C5CDD|nr:phospholipase D-like domain-containing protein [Cognatishimia sp. F0-27]MCC1493866.1 phosphatidylserine synthase [Cognatishimia sp. F0-27]